MLSEKHLFFTFIEDKPNDEQKDILITSALPYVNNVPHLGNIIGSTLSADAFTRYCRLRRRNCLYICGTDEYGTATETKALEEGISVQELTSKYYKLHLDIYDWFNISFDKFGRTSTEKQTEICQNIFWKLYKNNLLIEEIVEQLFCNNCSRFLADRYVEGICPYCAYEDARGDQCDKCGKLINAPELKNPKCKICSNSPILKNSKHLFLDLPKIQPRLEEWFNKKKNDPDCCWTNTAIRTVSSWLKEGLKKRCITRDLKWGTPVPLEGYEGKVFYVWFDAPIGYLSITASLIDNWEQWWKNPDKVDLFQFMAKDNVPFHGIIFPSMEIGTEENFTLVNNLIGIEYLNYENSKFSKSRGIGVFGNEARLTDIDPDIWRFYLFYIRPECQDSSFSWFDLMNKNNTELLNNLGNFINRVLTFLNKNFNGEISEIILDEKSIELIKETNCEIQEYFASMDKVKLRESITTILNIAKLGNKYVQSTSVWTLVKKDEESKKYAASIISLCVNLVVLLCFFIEPFMPSISEKLRNQLNIDKSLLQCKHFYQYLKPLHKINNSYPLFKKIEQSRIDEYKKLFGGERKK